MLDKINQIIEESKADFEKLIDLRDEHKELSKEFAKIEFADIKAIEKQAMKITENEQKQKYFSYKRHVLNTNIEYWLYEYVKPLVLEVLRQYEGKRVGDVTYSKIKSSFKDLTNDNFSLYIDRNVFNIWEASRIEISYKSFSVELLYNHFLKDNTIQRIEKLEDIQMYGTPHLIECVDLYIKNRVSEYEEITKAKRELAEKVRNFNRHNVIEQLVLDYQMR